MASFTIPRPGVGDYPAENQLTRTHLDILLAGSAPTGVVSGCEVHTLCDLHTLCDRPGLPEHDWSVAVEPGLVRSDGKQLAVAGAVLTVPRQDRSTSRLDLIVVGADGSPVVRPGALARSPSLPAREPGDVVLAYVVVPADPDRDGYLGSGSIVPLAVRVPSVADEGFQAPAWQAGGLVPRIYDGATIAPPPLKADVTIHAPAADSPGHPGMRATFILRQGDPPRRVRWDPAYRIGDRAIGEAPGSTTVFEFVNVGDGAWQLIGYLGDA
jgi:hypothetical protein